MPANVHFECGTCGKAFPAGWQARENHIYATGHRRPRFECESCSRWFNSEDACEQHMAARGHYSESSYECDLCDDTFSTEEECIDHETEDHWYCAGCNRSFDSYNNVKQHLNSRIHRGTQVLCPFCRGSFTTAAGMTHHLENARCPQARGLDRDELYRFIRRKDQGETITKNMVGWYGSIEYEATERAWNGHVYECYLCRKAFNTLGGLNMHLKSPVHQQALYHCPKRSCPKHFTTLGALINHLESETCGFVRFGDIQRGIDGLVRGNRLLN